ncbi:MAG: TolC family protein [bacterium]
MRKKLDIQPDWLCLGMAVAVALSGCATAGGHRKKIDQTALKIIEQKQKEALGHTEPFSLEPPELTLRKKLMLDQKLPYRSPASLGTKSLEPIKFWPQDDYLTAKGGIGAATAYFPGAATEVLESTESSASAPQEVPDTVNSGTNGSESVLNVTESVTEAAESIRNATETITDAAFPVTNSEPSVMNATPSLTNDLNGLTEIISGVKIDPSITPLHISLIDALQIAAQNNRQYQSQKENLFRAALNLDLQRDQYRNTFTGSWDSDISADLGGDETTSGIANGGLLNLSRQFLNGISVTARIGMDLVKMLNPFSASSASLFGDASISIPLLRGAGKHIVAEPLTQAERGAVYAIYSFERFKRSFAVDVASEYMRVLQAIDQINNQKANYEGIVRSTRRLRRLADAGREEPLNVDEAIQTELSSRNNLVSALFNYQSSLDSFKITLGLPPDAHIELDRGELDRLFESTKKISQIDISRMMDVEVPPADAPVVITPMTNEGAGPMELEEEDAIQLALENRLDLRTALGNVYDAQRAVVVAADALRAEFTLLGNAAAGEGRGLGSAKQPDNFDLDFEKGRYNAVLTLDLPLERTREIVSYRQSILNLESAVREYQDLEDSIKNNVRNRLRNLKDSRASLQIQAQAVSLAERRVRGMDLKLQAGRIDIRQLLDSQRSLLSSQNDLTRAMVDYRLGELELQRDLDVLQVDETGMWKEFSPQEWNNEHASE